MALACRCDRCHDFFEPNDKRICKIKVGMYPMINDNIIGPIIDKQSYDICDSCAKSMKNWLDDYRIDGEETKDE